MKLGVLTGIHDRHSNCFTGPAALRWPLLVTDGWCRFPWQPTRKARVSLRIWRSPYWRLLAGI